MAVCSFLARLDGACAVTGGEGTHQPPWGSESGARAEHGPRDFLCGGWVSASFTAEVSLVATQPVALSELPGQVFPLSPVRNGASPWRSDQACPVVRAA